MTQHHCISTVLQLQNRGTAGHVCPHDCTAISSHSFSVAILSLSFFCVHSVYSFFRLFFFFALSFVCFILGADLPASSPSLATAQPPAQPPAKPARPANCLTTHSSVNLCPHCKALVPLRRLRFVCSLSLSPAPCLSLAFSPPPSSTS